MQAEKGRRHSDLDDQDVMVISHSKLGEENGLNEEEILIVDGDTSLHKLFSRVLQSEFPGTVIDCASDGVEAVRLYEGRHHRLIVMDVEMPRMNGTRMRRAPALKVDPLQGASNIRSDRHAVAGETGS